MLSTRKLLKCLLLENMIHQVTKIITTFSTQVYRTTASPYHETTADDNQVSATVTGEKRSWEFAIHAF